MKPETLTIEIGNLPKELMDMCWDNTLHEVQTEASIIVAKQDHIHIDFEEVIKDDFLRDKIGQLVATAVTSYITTELRKHLK